MKYITATDLNQWADTKEAENQLPLLLRKLILNRIGWKNIEELDIPAGDSTWKPGFDGKLLIKKDTFSDLGKDGDYIVIECGTNKDITTKAKEDLKKRTDKYAKEPSFMQQHIFIFITIRRVQNKDALKTQMLTYIAGNQNWKDIKIFDADDIETWLETDFATTAWLAPKLNKPINIQSVDTFWYEWLATTEIPLNEKVLLARKNNNDKEIIAFLRENEKSFILRAESKKEALLYFIASLNTEDPLEKEGYKSKTIICKDKNIWNELTAHSENLKGYTLIPYFGIPDNLAHILNQGFKVFLPLDISENISSTHNIIKLETINKRELEAVLNEHLKSYDKANSLVQKSNGSIMSLQRLLVKKNAPLDTPQWVKAEDAEFLLSLSIFSQWHDRNLKDQNILLKATNTNSYEELVAKLTFYRNLSDPIINKIGDVWKILSPAIIIDYLASYLNKSTLERILENAVNVLGEINPKYDLPLSERWFSSTVLKYQPFSKELKDAIANGIAIFSSFNEKTVFHPDLNVQSNINQTISNIFKEKENWKLWASLKNILALLAEASPNTVLSVLEDVIINNPDTIKRIYSEGASTSITGECLQTGILWSLEVLAWKKEYLGQVANILMDLCKLDDGSNKWANKPDRSLAQIFMPWYPQTNASYDERIKVIENTIVNRYPDKDVSFRIISLLLPGIHSSHSHNNSKPKWREWNIKDKPQATKEEYFETISFLYSQSFKLLGNNGKRWKVIINNIPSMPDAELTTFISKINNEDFSTFDDSDLLIIKEALARFFHWLELQNDESKYNEEEISILKDVYNNKLIFKDITTQYLYLFSKTTGWDLHRKIDEPNELYTKALEDIISKKGINGIIDLSKQADLPHFIGFELSYLSLSVDQEKEFITKSLNENNKKLNDCVATYISKKFISDRFDFINRNFDAKWNEEQKKLFILSIPTSLSYWRWIEEKNLNDIYWNNFSKILKIEDQEQFEYAMHKLSEYNKTEEQFLLIAYNLDKEISSKIIAGILDKINLDKIKEQPVMISYHIEELFKKLYSNDDLEQDIFIGLEFKYLDFLTRKDCNIPKYIKKYLYDNPLFFAELIKNAYFPDSINEDEREKRRNNSELKRKAANSNHIIEAIKSVPTIKDGNIDEENLKDWINIVRKSLQESDLQKIGDQKLGQILSYSPIDPNDNIWPHSIIREIIETIKSKDLEIGIHIGKYNSRGVTTRAIGDGGEKERELSLTYREQANKIEFKYPRTAQILRDLADAYTRDARWNDIQDDL